MTEKNKGSKPVSIFKLFRYASCLDILMMVIGFVAAFFHGAAFPIAMNVFGDITTLFVHHDITRQVASVGLVSCPSSPMIPLNLTDLTGGLANCTASFLYTDPILGACNEFTLQDVITNISGSQIICRDNTNFIDEINIQVYAFIAIAVAAFILAWIHAWFYQMAAERQAHNIRLMYYQTILKQEIKWFDFNSTGELASRLSSGLDKIQIGIGDNLSIMIQWVSTFVVALIVGLYRRWELALFLFIIIPFMALAAGIFGRLGSIFSNREEKSYATAAGVAQEVLSAVKTVFAFQGQKKEIERYDSHLVAANKDGVWKGMSLGFSVGAIYFLIFLIYSVSFWFGGFLVSENIGQSGDVITVFFAILVGAVYIGQAAPNWIRLSEALGSAGEIYSTIDEIPTIDSSSEDGLKPDTFEPSVELKNVNFTYPARPDTQILQELALRVDVGQTIAIVGSSGSGKSTVVDLVQRFYDVNSGEVLIGGHNIRALNIKWLRSQIGLVSQEPVLFDTTIAENIRYGKEDATIEEIQEAAKSANAHDFISSLPGGYETIVGEGGDLISGGQKQRIAIARALVRDPKILLLDEATSALDSESEKIVQTALDNARVGRTTLVIAHRLSTIQNADLIIVLDKGRVQETGVHADLMTKKGKYFELVTAQSYMSDIHETAIPKYRPRAITSGKSLRSKSWRNKSMPRSLRRVRSLSSTVKVSSRKSLQSRPRQSVPEAEGGVELEEVDAPQRSRKLDKKPEPRLEVIHKPKYGDLDEEEENLPDVSIWRIMKYNSPRQWCIIVCGVVASFISGLIFPAFAIVFGEVLSVFAGSSDDILSNIHPWGAAFLALGVVLALSSFFKNLCFSVSGESLTQSIRSALFRSILRQEIGWFDDENNSTGKLTTKLSSDAGQLQGTAGVRVGTLLEMTTSLLASLAVAFAYSWITAFVIIAFLPVLGLASVLHFSLASGPSKSSNKGLREAFEIAIESIDNIRTVASFSLENKFHESFRQEVDGVYKFVAGLTVLYGLTYAFSESLIFFGYIVTFRFGAFIVTLPTDDILYTGYANIFRVFAALIFGAVAIGAASAFVPDYNKAKKSAKVVYAILDRSSEIDNFSEDGEKPADVRGEVEFHDVFFAYPQRAEINVLSSMELTVKPGQTLALVGTSGGGKSTVVSLIERFYDPHSGFVTFDNINIRDLNIQWLRSQVGIVSQEPVLFDGTIADNIRYGALFRDVSDEEVIDAAKSANIHSFIETLPMGYNTNVGAKGTQLSGGQKQRVAIARALLRDPKVLLLDEATSALDSESEKVVQEALDKAREGRTSIVIAHRLSTIYNSDQIAVLKCGKVAELGTHTELLAKKGLYYKLNISQFQNFKDASGKPARGGLADEANAEIAPADQ